jgi:penicillin-binding protein 1A
MAQAPCARSWAEPVTIEGWSPRNFEPEFLGPTTLGVALAHSINTVAARLADQMGRGRVIATARRLGITSPIGDVPAMALGVYGVSPLELATAYDALGNGGRRVTPYGIVRVTTASGRTLWRSPPPQTPQVVANPPLGEMDAMMRGVIARGTGTRAAIAGRDVAGKTGTTSDFKDAWFAGFTGGLTAVVWLGRDDDRPLRGVTGGSLPAEAWRAFMVAAAPHVGAGPIPAGPPAPAPAPPPPSPLPLAPPPGDPTGAAAPNATGASAPE